MILAILGAALAGDAPTVLDVFGEWVTKARDELVLDGQRPYRVVIGAQDRDRYSVSAEFGSLFAEGDERSRPGLVEVVVGDLQLDSSRFSARNNAPGASRNRPSFVVEDVPLAIERDLWLTTDDSFKTAVQRYQQKASALSQLPTAYPPSWTPVEPVTSVRHAERLPFDREALRALAVEGSRAFREVPGLRNGWVEVVVEQGEVELATSEGVRLVEPEERAVVYAWCDVVRSDGVQVFEEAQHIVVHPGQLPTIAELQAELRAMGERVRRRAEAPVVDDYEGPVVFEGQAAAQMFTWLVAAELEGTPPDPRPGATWEQLVRGGPRIGRRLLPAGWSVYDDPAAFPTDVPGGYAYDREGVRGERVELVRDGYVVDLVMSRVPRPERPASNGHARGPIQGEWEGRLSSWTLAAPRNLPDRAFDRMVEKARRASGQDRVLVVRSFQRGRPGSLPRPTDAVWRYADGREEPVLSVQFQNTNRRTLKDVLAVGGGEVARAYLAANSRGGTDGTTSGLPSLVHCPARVLVDDLEANFPGSDRQADTYPMPPLSTGEARP
ncbi:MAG TPA: metallopeptidase TldD-related protein [Myxococcota bacterium]|nr:metallopeptidase TldD-related protein [Myxococcota bacterium]